MTITPEQIQFQIDTTLSEGVSKVTTSTGVTVDESGLTVDKSNTDLKTTISDDGMTIKKKNDDEAMLVANSEGVDATNLRATTYLIVGKNSRFEDYTRDGESRTGCFWIGG
jgi:hypothetical protein